MKKVKLMLLAILVIALLTVSVGCNNNEVNNNFEPNNSTIVSEDANDSSNKTDIENKEEVGEDTKDEKQENKEEKVEETSKGIKFPLKEQGTLKIWSEMNKNRARFGESYEELPLFKELSEWTNIKFEFTHATIGEEEQSFNLMIASGKYPDIIWHFNMDKMGGGFGKMYDDGVIISLNELVDNYMPNFKKIYESDPQVKREVSYGENTIIALPCIWPSDSAMVNYGPLVRTDLIDQIDMKNPVTIDDFTNMLRQMKELEGIEYPFYTSAFGNRGLGTGGGLNSLAGVWDIAFGYYADNGEIKYGPAMPQYKELLSTLNLWYEEGLLDPDFANIKTGSDFTARQYSGKWGAFWDYVGLIPAINEKGRQAIEGFNVAPIEPLVKEASDKNEIVKIINTIYKDTTITSECKNKELAAAFLDIGYSKEGRELYTFGIEGQSYTKEGDLYKLTSLISDNPDGYSLFEMLYSYAGTNNGGPFLFDAVPYYKMVWNDPAQAEAIDKYTVNINNTIMNDPIPYSVPIEGENDSVATSFTDIKTRTEEAFYQFVLGQLPLDEFDNYIKELNGIGLKEVLEVKQAQYDRYFE